MIIDTNRDCTRHIEALKAAGVTTVIRYLNPLNASGEKCVKAPEAHALAEAGIRLGLVNEGWGDFAHGGISAGAGERDGGSSFAYAPSIGAPAGTCIYFAVDTDATAWQIRKLVLPYFQALAQFKGQFKTGVYGSGAVCEAITGAGLADYAWLSCSLGWLDSRAYLAANKWQLRQHLPHTVAGMDADGNDANGEFGDFAPFD